MSWTTQFGSPTRTSYTSIDRADTAMVGHAYMEFEPYIGTWVQPVSNATGTVVFFPAADGVRAINIDPGNSPYMSVRWGFPTKRPVEDTVTFHNGYVYFTCLDHRIYKVNADTGAEIWSWEGPVGFSVNPLVVTVGGDVMVFAGCRNGVFYALTDHGSSASVAWEFDTGYPVLNSATANANSNATVVWWCSMNGHVYRANAANGSSRVQSAKLLTAGFRMAPVVYDSSNDLLYVSIERNWKQATERGPGTWDASQMVIGPSIESWWLRQGEADESNNGIWFWKRVTGVNGPWPGGASSTVIDFLQDPDDTRYRRSLGMFDDSPNGDGKAEYRNLIILNGTTMAEKTWDFGDGVQRRAPILNHDGHTRPRPGIAILPDGTAVFYMLSVDNQYISVAYLYRWVPGSRYAWPVPGSAHNQDEAMQPTVGPVWADAPYGWEHGTDGNKHSSASGGKASFTNFDAFSPRCGADSYFQGPYDASMGGAYLAFGGSKGIYCPLQPYGHQVILSETCVVYLAYNCLIMWTTTGTDEKARVGNVVPRMDTSTAHPLPSVSVADVQARLEAEVASVLSLSGGNKLLRPAYVSHSNLDRTAENETANIPYNLQYERDLARTYVALCSAAEHVGNPAPIKAYIKWLWQNYPPYNQPGLIAWTGEAREWSTIPDGAWKDGDGNSRNLETDWVTYEQGPWGWNPYRVYATMRVCQVLADDPDIDPADAWDYLFEHWSGSGVFADTFAYKDTPYETDQIDKKDALIACYAAGMIGAKWICEQVGDTVRAAQCDTKLADLAQKYDDAWTNPLRPLGVAGTDDPYPVTGLGQNITWKSGRIWNLSRWWYWMTPEFAEYLRDNHADIVATMQSGIAEYRSLAPYWYLTHFHASMNEATMGPLHDRSMLQGEALFNRASQQELFSLLDIPAYTGDMLYIQNLVMALEASSPPSAPTFGAISVPSATPQYDTVEIDFDLSTVATNLFLPYDSAPPAGQVTVGVTVDAHFTDPYGEIHTVPAFYYRHFTTERRNNRDWVYPDPSGDTWKIRFTPTLPGTWRLVLSAEDAGGSATSEVYTIEVQEAAKPGFLEVSPTDPRYFQRENGTYFSGLGFNTAWQEFDWNNPTTAEARIRSNANYGINLLRYWPSEMPLFGGLINPLRQWDADQTGDTEPAISLFDADNQPGPGYSAEVLWRLHTTRGSNFTRFLALGWLTEPLAVKPDTTYRVSLKLLIPQDLLPAAAGDAGFVIKSHPGWLDADQVVSNMFGQPQSAYHLSTEERWQTVSCLYTTGSAEYYLPWLYFALVNVAADEKIVYFDDVQIAESLGGGRYGPNLFDKGVASQHEYISQRYSWALDHFLDYAGHQGVALKLVLLEKNDSIFCRIGEDGSVGVDYSNDNFYGPADQSVTRSRWLQQAFWRYCQARWGYSTAVHSWELCNEGDPGSVRHYNLAQFMAAYFNTFTANHHPSTTSFWAGFPAKEFWQNNDYPDVGYADLHRYVFEAEPEWNDTARAHINHAMQLPFTGQPVMRGETMVVEGDTSSYAKLLLKDTGGIWLKHWLWSQLHWDQLYELFWYARQVITQEDPPGKDQRKHFLALARFLEGIPIHNGNYEDLGATARGYLVVGQKDRINDRAHFWVRADGKVPYTWVNVVNKAAITKVTSDIIIPDMTPRRKYAVSSIDTSNGVSVIDSVMVSANRDGILILRSSQFKALRGLTGDVAFKVETGKGAKREVTVSTHKYHQLGTLRTYMNAELDGLPDGANRAGQPVNFTIDRAMYMAVELSVAKQAGPRAPGAQIALYAMRSVDDVNYGYGGDDLDPPPTDLLCTLALDASPEARLLTIDGLRAPATRAKILVKNLTGQPLADSGNMLRYRLYTTISETEVS